MKLLKNTSEASFSLSVVKGEKNLPEVLQFSELDLLRQVTQAFQIVYGGNFKKHSHKTA